MITPKLSKKKKKPSPAGIRICQVISESLGSFWENQFFRKEGCMKAAFQHSDSLNPKCRKPFVHEMVFQFLQISFKESVKDYGVYLPWDPQVTAEVSQ